MFIIVFFLILLNLLRKDEKGIDRMRKKKQILLCGNHLTVKLFQLLMMSQYSHFIFLTCRRAICEALS